MKNIDDFLYELDHPKETCDREFYLNPREISCFKNISQDKVKLIKLVGERLPREEFTDLVDIYNNYDPPIEDWGYVQCYYKDGSKILYPVGLTSTGRSISSYSDDTVARSITDVSRDYNAHTRVGEQSFTDFRFVKSVHDETDYYHLVYCTDGNVFLNKFDADGIAAIDYEKLGNELACALKARLDWYERNGSINCENNSYRKVGVRNLR